MMLERELMNTRRPTDTYCRFKEVIVDKEILRKSLKTWYKKRCMSDNSRQVITDLNKKFFIPADTISTIKMFYSLC